MGTRVIQLKDKVHRMDPAMCHQSYHRGKYMGLKANDIMVATARMYVLYNRYLKHGCQCASGLIAMHPTLLSHYRAIGTRYH